MRCRIIGRNIEFVFIDQVFQFLKSVGVKNIHSKFIKTDKNNQVSDFYDKLGFSINKDEDNQKEYLLYLDEYNNSNIDYIEINKYF
jgi:predicted enzyme involved in methoxymalonyl-ACP biosynthesis